MPDSTALEGVGPFGAVDAAPCFMCLTVDESNMVMNRQVRDSDLRHLLHISQDYAKQRASQFMFDCSISELPPLISVIVSVEHELLRRHWLALYV
jgi:hypothetical protein